MPTVRTQVPTRHKNTNKQTTNKSTNNQTISKDLFLLARKCAAGTSFREAWLCVFRLQFRQPLASEQAIRTTQKGMVLHTGGIPGCTGAQNLLRNCLCDSTGQSSMLESWRENGRKPLVELSVAVKAKLVVL